MQTFAKTFELEYSPRFIESKIEEIGADCKSSNLFHKKLTNLLTTYSMC